MWVGERLFTDTGRLFAIEPGDWRFEFGPRAGPPMERMVWNAHAATGAPTRAHERPLPVTQIRAQIRGRSRIGDTVRKLLGG